MPRRHALGQRAERPSADESAAGDKSCVDLGVY